MSKTSEPRRKRVCDRFRRWRTDLRGKSGGVAVVAGLVGFAVAAWFAPSVGSRSAAGDLSATFLGLLAAMAAILVVYVAAARKRAPILAVVVVVVGVLATLVGLLELPLATYRWAFAAAVGAFVCEVLAIVLNPDAGG